MKALFEEYGWLTVSVIVVTLLIAIASPVGASVKNSVTELITKFANTTSNVADVMGDDIANLNGELSGGSGGGTAYLSLNDKYVGYYADTNGDNTIDGVIFFDYAHGATTDTGYLGSGVAVTAKTTGLANYKMTNIDGKQVVQKINDGDDRFYVIALEGTKTASGDDTAYWYYSLFALADTSKTSTNFGTGKTNTATMKAIWDAGTPAQNTRDMWSANIPNGWFILSTDEWKVLGSELKKVSTISYDTNLLPLTTTDAGATLSFSDYYWASSLNTPTTAWYTYFGGSKMNNKGFIMSTSGLYYVRLATTY